MNRMHYRNIVFFYVIKLVDENVTSLEELAALATIPSRDGLLTMLAGGMIGIAKDLSIALNLYCEQKEN